MTFNNWQVSILQCDYFDNMYNKKLHKKLTKLNKLKIYFYKRKMHIEFFYRINMKGIQVVILIIILNST